MASISTTVDVAGENSPEYIAIQKTTDELTQMFSLDSSGATQKLFAAKLISQTLLQSTDTLSMIQSVLNYVKADAIQFYNFLKVVQALTLKLRNSSGVLNSIHKEFVGEIQKRISSGYSKSIQIQRGSAFLTFSRQHSDRVDSRKFTGKLYKNLETAGCNPWMDAENLQSGDCLSVTIYKTLDDCKAVVPVVTKGYAQSLWCMRELYYAISKQSIQIHAVVIEDGWEREDTGKWLDNVLRQRKMHLGVDPTDEKKMADIASKIVKSLSVTINPKSAFEDQRDGVVQGTKQFSQARKLIRDTCASYQGLGFGLDSVGTKAKYSFGLQTTSTTSYKINLDTSKDDSDSDSINVENHIQSVVQPQKICRKRKTKSKTAASQSSCRDGSTSKVSQPKLDAIKTDSDHESGIVTSSELILGDCVSGDETDNMTLQGNNEAHDATTHGGKNYVDDMLPAASPPHLSPGRHELVLAMSNSPMPFSTSVQNDLPDGEDGLIGDKHQLPMHVLASEQQPQQGASTFVCGLSPTENDWADKACYYVAVGATRETEKDKEIVELKEKKVVLENVLKKKEEEHAEAMKKESEEHEKEVNTLKQQLADKEQDLNDLQERRNLEIQEAVNRLMKEKAQKEGELKEAQSTIISLKRKNTELEGKFQKLSSEVETQEVELQKLQRTTQAEIKELESMLQAKSKEIEEFDKIKAKEIAAIEEKFEKKISRLETELECEKKAAKDREELLVTKSEVILLKQKNEYLTEANELKLKIESLGTKLAEEKAKRISKENECLKAQNDQLKLKHTESEVKLQEMDKELRQKDEKLNQCMRNLSLSSSAHSCELSLSVSRAATSDNTS